MSSEIGICVYGFVLHPFIIVLFYVIFRYPRNMITSVFQEIQHNKPPWGWGIVLKQKKESLFWVIFIILMCFVNDK